MTPEKQSRPAGNWTAHEAAWTAEASVPDAEVLDVSRDRRGVRTVTVSCPFCGRTHTHGWPEGDNREVVERVVRGEASL